jgi:DNA-binding NarL/FixJ family response regulator
VKTSRQGTKDEKWPTRILVADDHSAVLESLVPILESQFTVVRPDVVVLDISMPVMSGIDAAKQMRKGGSKAPIVFLTVHQDTDILAAAKRAGGLGYVVKNRLKTDLVFAIKEALEGRDFVSPFPER